MSDNFSPPKAYVTDTLTSPVGLSLKYRLRKRDYYAYLLVHQFLMPSLQLFKAAICLILFLIALESGPLGAGILAVLAYLAMWTVQAIFLVLLVATGDQRLLTEYEVVPSEDALQIITQFGRHQYFWHGIERLRESPWFVAVYMTKHIAQIVPRHAFENREQQKDFVRFIRTKLESR